MMNKEAEIADEEMSGTTPKPDYVISCHEHGEDVGVAYDRRKYPSCPVCHAMAETENLLKDFIDKLERALRK